MDWNFISQYSDLYKEAAILTVEIAWMGIAGSLVVGLLCGIIRYYKIPILRKIIGIYIELSRNTPLLIQLFFLYFGLPKIGIILESNTCAVIGLIFLGGSYMAEAFRSGMEAVDQTQIEAARSLGLTSGQVFYYVILPQAVGVAVPGIGANVIFLMKETSVFSIVALADLMHVAKDLIGLYYKTEEALLMLVISYLVILLPISFIFSGLERRLRYAESGD